VNDSLDSVNAFYQNRSFFDKFQKKVQLKFVVESPAENQIFRKK